MEMYIVLVLTVSSFLLGRLTNFESVNKTNKLNNELRIMTESRDRWREKYLVKVMRDKLKEIDCRNHEPSED